MRLNRIRELKSARENEFEPLAPLGDTAYSMEKFHLQKQRPWKRRILDSVAPGILALKDRSNRARLGFQLSIPAHSVVIGERWGYGNAWTRFWQAHSVKNIRAVLIQGCSVGDMATQKWLREKIPNLSGIEIQDLSDVWAESVPILEREFGAKIDFRQASVDDLPFADSQFDLVTSEAVYEHVHNLKVAFAEMYRVLKPDGIAFHSIGPMYYSFSGDHCISDYGLSAGYDHLLLPEADYRRKVLDQEFFKDKRDPDCNFWAVHEKFSYAKPEQYFALLAPYFDVEHVTVIIAEEALRYRKTYPDRWKRLLDAGVSEECLCVKSVHVRARRRTNQVNGDR